MSAPSRSFVILLVEDEKADAHLVKWALEENRYDVALHQATDGGEALAFLHRLAPRFADAPRPDLILLDLNMPRMGGLECLATIRREPSLKDIPVVILSTSYAESDVFASRDLGAVDYFTKPMDIRHLAETIRILGERWIAPGATTGKKTHAPLQSTVKLLEELPALPKIAHEILSMKLSTDEGNDLLLKLVKKDPAILARIIGMANSPLFGASKKIETVGGAAAVLGINRIKMVALGFAMISSMNRKPPGLLDVTYLWQHSMVFALAMDNLAKAMPPGKRPPEEEIYLAGLLHDIGFLVLDYVDPDLSDRFHAARLGTGAGRPVMELEAELLETNHCELGALLAEHWNLPATIVAILRYHHSDNVAPDAVGQPLIAMTSLMEKLLPTFDMLQPDLSGMDAGKWLALGIAADRADKIEAAMRKYAQEFVSAPA
jgi:HD-like signal output (HDOD) protein/AmiR/NasT family two-component response regulator